MQSDISTKRKQKGILGCGGVKTIYYEEKYNGNAWQIKIKLHSNKGN